MDRLTSFGAVLALSLGGAAANGAIIVTQGASAPQYAQHQIDFEELAPGPMAMDQYLASDGVNFMSGVGDGGGVDDWDAVFGPFGLGEGQSHVGSFGTFLNFTGDVNEMSFQVWNNGTDPIFGGIGIFVFNDDVEVGAFFTIPSWGGIGDEWFNITTTDGDTFDDVRIIDFSFSSFGIFTDNYSWTAVPGPGALSLLALAGLCTRRRRV